FIHDFKHGISAISNHPVPLLSMKEHISRPWSEKQRWPVRRAHVLAVFPMRAVPGRAEIFLDF
ncbi:hypothetical protein, partial [Rhizobium sp. CSW-27]|uniref:hypothetical protein n=1 Tax=Rhizobium sp. CSW-27 TaxID=2839985 RepID=UPI001C031B0E